jgi:hypothetical protein
MVVIFCLKNKLMHSDNLFYKSNLFGYENRTPINLFLIHAELKIRGVLIALNRKDRAIPHNNTSSFAVAKVLSFFSIHTENIFVRNSGTTLTKIIMSLILFVTELFFKLHTC